MYAQQHFPPGHVVVQVPVKQACPALPRRGFCRILLCIVVWRGSLWAANFPIPRGLHRTYAVF